VTQLKSVEQFQWELERKISLSRQIS